MNTLIQRIDRLRGLAYAVKEALYAQPQHPLTMEHLTNACQIILPTPEKQVTS